MPVGFWETANHTGFCERESLPITVSEYWPVESELANTFSSLAISGFAVWGLKYANPRRERFFIFTLCYSFMFCNGLASAAYHFTGFFGFGLLDSFCMFLQAWLYTVASVSTLLAQTHRTFMINCVIVLTVGLVVALVTDATNLSATATRIIFAVFTAVPLFVTTTSIIHAAHALKVCWARACGATAMSAFAWLGDFFLCKRYVWWRYVFAHSIWHIGVGYALLCFIVLIIGLNDQEDIYELEWWPARSPMHWVLPLPCLKRKPQV